MNICFNCMRESQGEKCSHCGYSSETRVDNRFLLPGTHLDGRFTVGVGQERESTPVTNSYVGWDHTDNEKVRITEYFPVEILRRIGEERRISLFDYEKAEENRKGFDLFAKQTKVNEKLSAVAGVLPIKRAFIENSGVYYVTQCPEGQSLRERVENSGPIPFDEVKVLFSTLPMTVRDLRRNGIAFCGICPENILITESGRIAIIDFAKADFQRKLRELYTHEQEDNGFFPDEYFTEELSEASEVYSVSATIFYAVTGINPAHINEEEGYSLSYELEKCRGLDDEQKLAIMRGLRRDASTRQQTLDELYGELFTAPQKDVRITVMRILSVMAAAAVLVVGFFAIKANVDGGTQQEGTDIQTEARQIPNLKGKTVSQVEEMLEKAGLGKENYRISGTENAADVKAGTVFYQDVKAGTEFSSGEDVIIRIKLAEETPVPEDPQSQEAIMPQLNGMLREAAVNALSIAGFRNVDFETGINPVYEDGLVFAQSVEAGAEISKDTKIIIRIASGGNETEDGTQEE